MAAEAKGGARRRKDQEMAAHLVALGIYHGHRSSPWNQGVNYPKSGEVGSAAYRRMRRA